MPGKEQLDEIRVCTYTLTINQSIKAAVPDGELLARIVFDGMARRGELRREGIHCHIRATRPGVGEYVAVDLDENNGKPAGTFGWGVCRHGHGLQSLPPLSEQQARDLAEKLNA